MIKIQPGHIVILNQQVGVYGVLSYKALIRLQNNKDFAYKFNRKLTSLWNWSIPRKVKAANRMLTKLNLGNVRMLTGSEIKLIRKKQIAPPGSLLCALPNNIKEKEIIHYEP